MLIPESAHMLGCVCVHVSLCVNILIVSIHLHMNICAFMSVWRVCMHCYQYINILLAQCLRVWLSVWLPRSSCGVFYIGVDR